MFPPFGGRIAWIGCKVKLAIRMGAINISEEEMFFSEEKNQKTFTSGAVGKYGTWPAE
jgi:hypothetical protein